MGASEEPGTNDQNPSSKASDRHPQFYKERDYNSSVDGDCVICLRLIFSNIITEHHRPEYTKGTFFRYAKCDVALLLLNDGVRPSIGAPGVRTPGSTIICLKPILSHIMTKHHGWLPTCLQYKFPH
jgi:hypothetical protein